MDVFTLTIPNTTALSNAANLKGKDLVGIEMPATWTTANLTIQYSWDGVTFGNLYDSSGNELTITAAVSRFIAVTNVKGVPYLRIRSGTSATPVNQGGDRALKIIAV